jgi:GTP-binding protein
VRIGDREFDWQPNTGEYISGPRGTDIRLEETDTRPSAAARLAARKARRVRGDDELLHMSSDGTVSSVSMASRPILVQDDEDDLTDDE